MLADVPAKDSSANTKSIKREPPRHKAVASWRVFSRFRVAASVNLHGARPWYPGECSPLSCVAASVSLHGARPWHPGDWKQPGSHVQGSAVLTSINLRDHLPPFASPFRQATHLLCALPRATRVQTDPLECRSDRHRTDPAPAFVVHRQLLLLV